MMILELQDLNKSQIKDIKKLEYICKPRDGLKEDVFLSNKLNFNKNIKCYFLLYEDEKLISFISMFMPSSDQAEISAYTHPSERRKGYFKLLLKNATEELSKYEIKDILFVQEPTSKSAKCVLENLGAKYEFSEYVLVYNQNNISISKGDLKLVPVSRKDIDEVAALHVNIFDKTLEMGQSMVNKALDSKEIIPYMAKLNDEIFGICTISLESNDGFIYGLGILKKYQGQGYGKEMLKMLIEKLLHMDIQHILLEVDSKNNKAYNLYTENGFEIRTQFDYYRYSI